MKINSYHTLHVSVEDYDASSDTLHLSASSETESLDVALRFADNDMSVQSFSSSYSDHHASVFATRALAAIIETLLPCDPTEIEDFTIDVRVEDLTSV